VGKSGRNDGIKKMRKMIYAKYTLENELDKLQNQTFNYFLNETNPVNGLVADTSAPDSPAGIGATGIGLSCYPVAVERGMMARSMAAERVLTTLKFFEKSRNGHEPEATGYNGFYYHFLDINSGRRARMSELSVFGTSILLAGALTASMYFNKANRTEKMIREIADILYRRADWNWAFNYGPTLKQGWKPETGFLKYSWNGYDEGHLPYILALGSPTFPIPAESYDVWTSSFKWINSYGIEYLYGGPLFVHQLPHIWIDFRGIQDKYMRGKSSDYFENSARAARIQQRYAVENPKNFEKYGKYCWGITLSYGPGPDSRNINGEEREFFSFLRRGVPFGPDDGTISPWAAVSSLPFAPEIVIPTIDYLFHESDLNTANSYGFRPSYNPTYAQTPNTPHGWCSSWHIGLNQGPAILHIENYRNEFLWKLMSECPYIIQGLTLAGFSGGWLKYKTENVMQQQIEQDYVL
jgi:hypothetical protein